MIKGLEEKRRTQERKCRQNKEVGGNGYATSFQEHRRMRTRGTESLNCSE